MCSSFEIFITLVIFDLKHKKWLKFPYLQGVPTILSVPLTKKIKDYKIYIFFIFLIICTFKADINRLEFERSRVLTSMRPSHTIDFKNDTNCYSAPQINEFELGK